MMSRLFIQEGSMIRHLANAQLAGIYTARLSVVWRARPDADQISTCPLSRVLTYKNLIYLLNFQFNSLLPRMYYFMFVSPFVCSFLCMFVCLTELTTVSILHLPSFFSNIFIVLHHIATSNTLHKIDTISTYYVPWQRYTLPENL